MVRSALAANRSLAVLDWIASHPQVSFTLSELSRALSVNIPSLMAVLQSLTQSGYLARDSISKTYEAGPALIAIGLSAGGRGRTFRILEKELQLLAEAVGTECSASVAIGDRAMSVAAAGRPGRKSVPVRVGTRSPLMAPVGHVFVAWSPPAQINAWIAGAESARNKIDRARIERELSVIRENGYSAFHYRNASYQAAEALERVLTDPKNRVHREHVKAATAACFAQRELITPRPGKLYDVSNVAAPVFDAHGEVVMIIVMNGFNRIEGATLLGHIERLLQTTRLLTKQEAGRLPMLRAVRD